MGKVEAGMKLTNLYDLSLSKAKIIKPEEVRTLEVKGLVDSGATGLCLP